MSVTRSPFRSPVRGPTQSPFGAGRLLERTRTFRDRVKNEGGSIEDDCLKGLYDPILRTVKDWGLLPDLVFFGSASAVEINSGSIPRLFDASGNEYDPTQNDTAKQPALKKDSIGGHWGGDYDGSGDLLHTDLPSAVSRPHTLLSVMQTDETSGDNRWATQYNDNTTGGGSPIYFKYSGEFQLWGGSNSISGQTTDKNPHLLSGWLDGSGNGKFWIDGTSQGTGSSLGQNDAKGVTLAEGDSDPWDGIKTIDILFGPVQLLESQISELEKIINDYYSIY